jgi:type IV secretory pathway TraG/TraD family ATPase VirD4
MATARELADLTARPMGERARQLRPGLEVLQDLEETQVGYRIARMGTAGPLLYGSWEDTTLAMMGPRSGKTAAIAAPTVLRAPGPVLATSIRADIYTLTATSRAKCGTVWALDPQQIAHLPRTFWWDMISEARTFEGAHRLAGHFVGLKGSAEKVESDFWLGAARSLLTGVFLAAARSGRRLADVQHWLATPTDQTPLRVLEEMGPALADDLKSRMKTAPETREGIYQTARESVSSLLDPEIAAWVTPDDSLPQFRPDAFVTSTDTLYLLAKKGTAGAAGVVAALTDAVLRAAERAAETQGGRLDPPLLPVLDEAANIARIGDLPDFLSYCGGMGILPLVVVQNYPQGEAAWGKTGMASLWSTATVTLVGAGINDPRLAEDVSKLVGSKDMPMTSISHGSMGRSTSTSHQLRRIMPPDQVRSMPKLHAVLLVTGHRAAYVRLCPWFSDRQLRHVGAEHRAQQRALKQRAVAAGQR